MKKKYNQIRMAQAPTTRVIKGNTVAVRRQRTISQPRPPFGHFSG